MKISYIASIQRISVLELFLNSMIKTFKVLRIEETKMRSEIPEGESLFAKDKKREFFILGKAFAPNLKGFAKL
jgi:hypothetical protein